MFALRWIGSSTKKSSLPLKVSISSSHEHAIVAPNHEQQHHLGFHHHQYPTTSNASGYSRGDRLLEIPAKALLNSHWVADLNYFGSVDAKVDMKTFKTEELSALTGPYTSPTGIYEYIKSLPFLGSLSCSVDSLTAGEWTEILIEYTVGGSGLADGAWIKGTFKFYSVGADCLTEPHGGCN